MAEVASAAVAVAMAEAAPMVEAAGAAADDPGFRRASGD